MKKINIIYWIFTILGAGMMLAFAVFPYIMNTKETQDFMVGFLHYPPYIIPMLGWAKLLGVLAILLPIPARLKEWAYAGLIFDLLGATYSCIAAAGWKVSPSMLFMLAWIVPIVISYIYFHKRLNAKQLASKSMSNNFKMA